MSDIENRLAGLRLRQRAVEAAPSLAAYEQLVRDVLAFAEDVSLPDAPGDGLRAAVRDILRNVATYHDVGSIHEALGAALASAKGERLDVEELVRALRVIHSWAAYTALAEARAIANEYNRLDPAFASAKSATVSDVHPPCGETLKCPCWRQGANDEAQLHQSRRTTRELTDYIRAVGDGDPTMTNEQMAEAVYRVYGPAPLYTPDSGLADLHRAIDEWHLRQLGLAMAEVRAVTLEGNDDASS